MYEQKQIILDGKFLGNNVVINRYFELIYNISPLIIKNFINIINENSFLSKPVRIKKYSFTENNCINIYFKSKVASGEIQLAYILNKNEELLVDTYKLSITEGENCGYFISKQNNKAKLNLNKTNQDQYKIYQSEEEFIEIADNNQICQVDENHTEAETNEKTEELIEENINTPDEECLIDNSISDNNTENPSNINDSTIEDEVLNTENSEEDHKTIEQITPESDINQEEQAIDDENSIESENITDNNEEISSSDKNTEENELNNKSEEFTKEEAEIEEEVELSSEETGIEKGEITSETEKNTDNNSSQEEIKNETEDDFNESEQIIYKDYENNAETETIYNNYTESTDNLNNISLNTDDELANFTDTKKIDEDEILSEISKNNKNCEEIINKINEAIEVQIYKNANIEKEDSNCKKLDDFNLIDFFDTIPKVTDDLEDNEPESVAENIEITNTDNEEKLNIKENSFHKRNRKYYKLNRNEKIALYQNILEGYDNLMIENKLNKFKENFNSIQKENNLTIEDVLDAQVELLVDNKSKAFRILGGDSKQDVIQIDDEIFLSKDTIYTWGDVYLVE